METARKIPVILDTDIGSDIDDTWALAMMLRCPELDVRLITTATGDPVYRAKLVAKLLETAGRTDVPVGVGLPTDGDWPEHQGKYVSGYELCAYLGAVREDAVAAMIEVIEASETPVTLLVIGPVTNIAELLRRRPDLAGQVDFVGMHGSVKVGYRGRPGAVPEYNVFHDAPASQVVFAADWRSVTITPLDTCGNLVLRGEPYQQVLAAEDALTKAVIENYHYWLERPDRNYDFPNESSVLYDTVAVHLAYSREWLKMERLPIVIEDDGLMRVDEAGKLMDVAMEWTDESAFHADLARRLTASISCDN